MNESGIELPMANRVYQREKNGKATIAFTSAQPVQARVRKGAKTILPWRECRGAIRDVPTGGPYTIEFKTKDETIAAANGILVGDLWVLAGQSNMDGYGKLIDLEPPSPMVHCFYYDEHWDIAKDPLCFCLDSIDPVHWMNVPNPDDLPAARENDHRWRDAGGGLGVRFGKDLYKAAGVPVGLIICSHGGTSLDQWDPAKKAMGGHSLYGSMLRRVGVCGGKVTGFLWYQGESDANEPCAPTFKERMTRFIAAVREDLGNPCLPFIQVQIARFFTDETQCPPQWWNLVQQAQLDLQREIAGVATVAAIDCTLSDIIHPDSISGRRIGARMAELALVLAYGKKAPLAPIPESVRFGDKARTTLVVTYKNVRGSLVPARGIWGFWVENASGERIVIQSAEAKGSRVILRLAKSLSPNAKLWYGRGLNPNTNLRDKAFAAPVFGPVVVG